MPTTQQGGSRSGHNATEPAASKSHGPTINARRRQLPGSRTIVGALLVAISLLGTYAVASGAVGGNEHGVLVANRELLPGARLTASDVRVVQVTLPAAARAGLATPDDRLDNVAVLGPVRPGEFLQAGNIVSRNSATVRPEVSFAVARSRALGGDIRSGETVDVIVTDKGGTPGLARTAVFGATVVKVDRGSGNSVGSNGDVTITLAVNDRAEASAVAAAVDQSQVTLLRTTGLTAQTP